MVELCKHRIKALQLDEETLFQQAQNIGVGKCNQFTIYSIPKIDLLIIYSHFFLNH